MAVFKCKICGGTLEINVGETVATCEYCGTKQTLPKLDNEKKANLFDRANHFRRNNDFDKAMGIYEQILNEDTEDAESYWSIVLCRYGIEYVEDPSSRKRVPTVNRAQFTSIFDDEDYKSAIKYADSYQKNIYESEAVVINEIQKGILAISQKEEPFDVFICYKENDNNGRRTQDSVLATELYYELIKEGFKVFFSRITLEDKLGVAYEPYIFAALHSAKVMVALGTKPDHFNAVWVKNEWSRYLSLIKNGANKILIPAYRDMDPYDLPEEFSHLQAQDMSKLGFMQDLVRGIKKLVSVDTSLGGKETVVVQSATSGNASALVKRGFLALEDEEWEKADEFFEQALNQNAEDAQAYLGKLMAELKVSKEENLIECKEPFENMSNYQKVLRFADDNLKKTIESYIDKINTRIEEERAEVERAKLEKIYIDAVSLMKNANPELAAKLFLKIPDYKDAKNLAEECRQLAEDLRKDDILKNVNGLLEGTHYWNGKETDFKTYENAIVQLRSISGYKDADDKVEICQRKVEEIKIKIEKDRVEQEKQRLEKEHQEEITRVEAEKRMKRNKKIVAIAIPIICIVITLIIILNVVIIPAANRNMAIEKYGEEFERLQVGDTYIFGSFEQDNNTSNGKEKIEWIVLEKQNGKAFVVTKYAIERWPYNTAYAATDWQHCTLRRWLNNDFINSAFSDIEKAVIPSVTVSADKNPKYRTNPGKVTKDKVFLLSVTEANEYFKSDIARQCMLTTYAKDKGTPYYSNGCYWWLRSPGWDQCGAAIVDVDGNINKYGRGVDVHVAVRPAMWIDLSTTN